MAAKQGNVKIITDDSQFQPLLASAGAKLVVVDFFATWCGPCRTIAPVFADFSVKYSAALFIKVDVDQCTNLAKSTKGPRKETAGKYGITAMPTFLFFRNKVKIDALQGANEQDLEKKIKKHLGSADGSDGDLGVPGQIDLTSMISTAGCHCLNESDKHTFQGIFKKGPEYLESDCDEQLIITVSFNQPVKIHSLKIQAPDDGRGPKVIKIFKNQPIQVDFDAAEAMESAQTLELKPEDLDGEKLLGLRYVKFQNIQNVVFFVSSNQGDEETTVINRLVIVGSPIDATNMGEFKRVAGKAGESH